MTFVYFAVEGDADVSVAERQIRHVATLHTGRSWPEACRGSINGFRV